MAIPVDTTLNLRSGRAAAAVTDTTPDAAANSESTTAALSLGFTEVVTALLAAHLLLYRLGLRFALKTDSSARTKVIIASKFAIGWCAAAGAGNLHGLSSIWALVANLVGGLFVATAPDFISVCFTVVGTSSIFIMTLLHLGCTAAPTFGAAATGIIGSVVTCLLIAVCSVALLCIKFVFTNWEVLVLPPFAALTVAAAVGLAPAWLYGLDAAAGLAPAGPASTGTDDLILAGLVVAGYAIQLLCKQKSLTEESEVDVSNPMGAQNDLVKHLLNDNIDVANLDRRGLLEGRFPIISKMSDGAANGKDLLDEVTGAPATRSASGGILERAERTGGNLTDNEKQVLAICEKDEEQRNRILFGGGLW